MQEHPLIELYITISDEQQNQAVENMLSTVNLDNVVLQTLHLAGIAQQIMLTVLITDDEGIREMNQQYRQQDKPTDVLSFPLLNAPLVQAPADQLWTPQESEAGEQAVSEEQPEFVTPPGMVTNLGDIVISWPTIERQAEQAGHSAIYELFYLLSHGVLHLVGYDDHTEAGYQAMVATQEAALRAVGQKA
ncbi:MAG TPA: rRNA maturation RNase YbeY [Ktedonobacteraceae bacterium]|jgi:probable rRNA maturation factor|nr:rRNA maturation RNase YbeY [Ktedonobacteraceae bacterium]